MIDRIIVENFKNLRKVDLSLGRMNLFIGTNASGKSNFLDALRMLQGIGNGFTISEILDGKPQSATTAAWDGIRGGSSNAGYFGKDEVTITTFGTSDDGFADKWQYVVSFSPTHGRLIRERFQDGDVAYDAPVGTHPEFECERSVVWQVANGSAVWGVTRWGEKRWHSATADCAIKLVRMLANTQRFDPTPEILQQYSRVPHVRRIGEHGENFAALIRAICLDEKTKYAYLSWLQELRPEEVENVGTLSGVEGDTLFMLRENGREFSARALSEGTLRFAAITAAFFQPDMPGIMTIEEIENGIHASRLRTLVELLRSQSKRSKTQIFASTHSPTTLEWLHESEYPTTFLCSRDESTGESTIRPLSEVPHFAEVVKKVPLAELLAEGWLEMAL